MNASGMKDGSTIVMLRLMLSNSLSFVTSALITYDETKETCSVIDNKLNSIQEDLSPI